jgi:hypothetical protein
MKPLFAVLVITAICAFAGERAPNYPVIFFGPRVHHSPFTSDPAGSSPAPNASKPPSIVAWQGNVVNVKALSPETPNTLEWDGEVTVAVHYNNSSQDKVRIFARPYFQDKQVVRCGYHPSPDYAPGTNGDMEGWFTCCGPTSVDEVRVTMHDSITNEIIASAKIPVHFDWQIMPPNPTPRPQEQN